MSVILAVHALEPLVEGEGTLDVSLADTASRGHICHIHRLSRLGLEPVPQLPEGKVTHHLLTGHYEVGQTGNLYRNRKYEFNSAHVESFQNNSGTKPLKAYFDKTLLTDNLI